jgi:hypothetical protein
LERFVRKGELTPKRELRDWPYHVTVTVPPLGLGTRLNEISDFVAGMDHQKSPPPVGVSRTL